MLEFFSDPSGKNIVVNDLNAGKYWHFSSEDKETIGFILERIEADYPKAHIRLKELYGEMAHRRYLMAARFIRCNFSENDNQPDIDDAQNLRLEIVKCPLKGNCNFCKDYKVICEPELNTTLTEREKEVAILYAAGHNIDEIAEKLFISPNTVRNHRQRIFKKLKINSQSELVNWAYKNKLI